MNLNFKPGAAILVPLTKISNWKESIIKASCKQQLSDIEQKDQQSDSDQASPYSTDHTWVAKKKL